MAKETGSAQPVNLKKNDTVVLSHGCKNDWQDQRYGKGMRLMNSCKNGEKYRCTNCGELR